MPVTEQLKTLVDQMPDPDDRGMYTTNIDKENIDKAVAAIAMGGKESVLGLISLLAEPGSAADAKPHYALHCVVNYPLVANNESLRKEICETLAAQLENESLLPANRAYLCQELQWAGRDEACAGLGKVLLNDDLTDAAATSLIAIGGERAAAQLRAAAPRATGKARLNLIDALAALPDPKSAAIFEQTLADSDREVRLAAATGLGQLGQADSAESLLKAADVAQGWERTQLTKSCLVLAEKLAAVGNKPAAKRIYERLHTTRTGHTTHTGKSEQHIRDAAQRGLAADDQPILLFDGQSLNGWTNSSGDEPGAGWVVEDGALVRKDKAGDLWTKERFGDFELELEFKTKGNSGVFIRTDSPKNNVQTGIEIQIHKPGGPGKHSVGAVYGALAPTKNAATDGWNQLVITAKDNELQVKLNGELIIEMDLNRWSTAGQNPDGSKNKFKTALKDFKREGHIGFQDHGAEVAYRNVRIRRQ